MDRNSTDTVRLIELARAGNVVALNTSKMGKRVRPASGIRLIL